MTLTLPILAILFLFCLLMVVDRCEERMKRYYDELDPDPAPNAHGTAPDWDWPGRDPR